MTNDDWAEVLQHTRKRVREEGLERIDELVTMDFERSNSAKWDFQRYLTGVIGALSERSGRGVTRAISILRNSLMSDSVEQLEGIEVSVIEEDRPSYGVDRIRLEPTDDYSPLIDELKKLLYSVEVMESGNE